MAMVNGTKTRKRHEETPIRLDESLISSNPQGKDDLVTIGSGAMHWVWAFSPGKKLLIRPSEMLRQFQFQEQNCILGELPPRLD